MHDRRTENSLGRHAHRLAAAPRCVIMTFLLSLVAGAGAVAWTARPLPALRGVEGPCPLGSLATVAQVDRALSQDPASCNGRIVWVRGRAVRSLTWQAPDSLVLQSALVDGPVPSSLLPLTVTWGRPDPLLSALRRWPLLGRLVPSPQSLRMGTSAAYRVQLRAPTSQAAGAASAVLLDPDSSGS